MYRESAKRGQASREEWIARVDEILSAQDARSEELSSLVTGNLPAGWMEALPSFQPGVDNLATRYVVLSCPQFFLRLHCLCLCSLFGLRSCGWPL